MPFIHSFFCCLSFLVMRVKAFQGWGKDVGSRIDDDVALAAVSFSDMYVCCHATSASAWETIQKQGLKSMSRKHIHFHSSAEAAMRTDKEILIHLNTTKWLKDGGELFVADNHVLLTSGMQGIIAPKYFSEVQQLYPCPKVLWEKRVPGRWTRHKSMNRLRDV